MDIDNIKELCTQRRKELKLTQAELGTLAGISREMIVRFENGATHDIGLRRFLRLLIALNLDLQLKPRHERPTTDELSTLFPDDSDE
jgi:transcriptional regulator with XRE-family HTH domain